MHVEVAPFLRTGSECALVLLFLIQLLDRLYVDELILLSCCFEIFLRLNQEDRLAILNQLNLSLPLLHVLERYRVVRGDANYKGICTSVSLAAIRAVHFISACVVELDEVVLALDYLLAFVDV